MTERTPVESATSDRVHVVWDWNGTLLDDAATVIEATTATFAAAGIPLTVSAEMYRRNFTRPIPLFYERLLGRAISVEEWSELDRAFHREYRRLHRRCTLAVGAREVLAEIESRGWTQSLCSMLPHEHLIPAVDQHGIAGYFQRIDGLRGGERGGAKLTHLLQHLAGLDGAAPHAVLIGDTVDDALAAQGAGISCILVDGGEGLHDPAAIGDAGAPIAASLHEALGLLTSGRPASPSRPQAVVAAAPKASSTSASNPDLDR